MPIDHLIAKAQTIINHYLAIAIEAPTHFTRSHWIFFSAIACLFGFFCMRGFGSRTKY
jgi:hypothetical protein